MEVEEWTDGTVSEPDSFETKTLGLVVEVEGQSSNFTGKVPGKVEL